MDRMKGRLSLPRAALCCALLLTCAGVVHAAAPAAKPKTSGPPKAKKGAGLYSAGGRVYPAHGNDKNWVKPGGAEAYRKWQAFNRAQAAKKAKPPAPTHKSAPPPVAAKKQRPHQRK
jgi:hypothetical protein